MKLPSEEYWKLAWTSRFDLVAHQIIKESERALIERAEKTEARLAAVGQAALDLESYVQLEKELKLRIANAQAQIEDIETRPKSKLNDARICRRRVLKQTLESILRLEALQSSKQ